MDRQIRKQARNDQATDHVGRPRCPPQAVRDPLKTVDCSGGEVSRTLHGLMSDVRKAGQRHENHNACMM